MKRILLSMIAYAVVCMNASAQQINVIGVNPNPACRQTLLTVFFNATQTLPPGNYDIQFSADSTGSFTNYWSLGGFFLSQLNATMVGANVVIPGVGPGGCYRVRVSRLTAPLITGTPSACLEVKYCTETITTLGAPVLNDVDTVCAFSAIDVPFYSTAVYGPDNNYIAQLSDEFGSFSNPHMLGILNSGQTFNPANGSLPGSVAGYIPAVPAGCDYYVRVVSSPSYHSTTTYGPFCIKHCDILTDNNGTDIRFCISETAGDDTIIGIAINQWDSTAVYNPGNNFIVELLDVQSMQIVNQGGLGTATASASTSLTITVPDLNNLLSLGIQPGDYYMRIIADNSSQPWNSNGTITRLSIGAPADSSSSLVPDRSFVCPGNPFASMTINPYNHNSSYEWQSDIFFPQAPAIYNTPTLQFNFSTVNPGGYDFYIREISYGCYGPFSPAYTIYVLNNPDIYLSGADTLYSGDTAAFMATHLDFAIYDWTISAGTIVSDSGETAMMRFDSAGVVSVKVEATTACGIVQDSMVVVVLPDTIISSDIHSFAQHEISLYPNPTGDYIIISMPSQYHFNVIISDISGKEVFEDYSVPNEKIDVSSLVPGIYFVKIADNNGTFAYKKLMKPD